MYVPFIDFKNLYFNQIFREKKNKQKTDCLEK
jgi:hypothetical protein